MVSLGRFIPEGSRRRETDVADCPEEGVCNDV